MFTYTYESYTDGARTDVQADSPEHAMTEALGPLAPFLTLDGVVVRWDGDPIGTISSPATYTD